VNAHVVRAPSRRDRVRAATSQEIVATARRLLVEQGVTAVSLRAIAREMGMTAPALYRYYDSHEELLHHLVGDIFTELAGYLHTSIKAAEREFLAGGSSAPGDRAVSRGQAISRGQAASGNVAPPGDLAPSGDLAPPGDLAPSGDLGAAGDLGASGDLAPSGDLGASRGRPGDLIAVQLIAACRAFRSWALEHQPEFGMIFGSPLPGLDLMHDDPVAECGFRFGQVFLDLFSELWRRWPFRAPADDEIDPSLRRQLAHYHDLVGADLPLGALHTFLRCWVLLYGTVSLEVFGHLRFALDDAAPLFELMLADLAAMIGLEYPMPS